MGGHSEDYTFRILKDLIYSIALGVHILLSIDRADVAQKEYAAARTWADDSLLIQLIEAYLGIHSGGRAAQQAYYVYDELAQNPSEAGKVSSVPSLIGKAVAKAVSGEHAEASTVLTEAGELVGGIAHLWCRM